MMNETDRSIYFTNRDPMTSTVATPNRTCAENRLPGRTTRLVALYAARSAFALAWAGAFAASASSLDALSISLLILYPLVDVAAAAYDLGFVGADGVRRRLL